MSIKESVEPHIDSLMEILFAQCSDLEALLALARKETEAAESEDFEQVLDLVKQRATLGDRLEVYHRQLAEFRASMGESADTALSSPVAAQTAALITAIKLEDARSLPMLHASRNTARQKVMRAARAAKNIGAYASKEHHIPTACDKRI